MSGFLVSIFIKAGILKLFLHFYLLCNDDESACSVPLLKPRTEPSFLPQVLVVILFILVSQKNTKLMNGNKEWQQKDQEVILSA